MPQDRIPVSFSFPKELALDIRYYFKTQVGVISSREIENRIRSMIPKRKV